MKTSTLKILLLTAALLIAGFLGFAQDKQEKYGYSKVSFDFLEEENTRNKYILDSCIVETKKATRKNELIRMHFRKAKKLKFEIKNYNK